MNEENNNDVLIDKELSSESLEEIAGGYKSTPRVSNENKYIFKVMCAKCGHEELMVLEKQDVKTWVCINCKAWNVSKMKKGSTSYCYTYTADEYQRLLKGRNMI